MPARRSDDPSFTDDQDPTKATEYWTSMRRDAAVPASITRDAPDHPADDDRSESADSGAACDDARTEDDGADE